MPHAYSRSSAAAGADRIRQIHGTPLLSGLRVLVVEDQPDSLELMTALLRGRGATVIGVTSVREAVAQFNGGAPDLLVTDIGLPDEDGFELLRQVRRLDNTRTGRFRPSP